VAYAIPPSIRASIRDTSWKRKPEFPSSAVPGPDQSARLQQANPMIPEGNSFQRGY
jgi:hypothetical protein